MTNNYKSRLIIDNYPGIKCDTKVLKDYEFELGFGGVVGIKRLPDIPFFDKIQTYKKDCDIKEILKKVQITGDYSLLNRVQTHYEDTTIAPDLKKNPLQARAFADKTLSEYKKLDKSLTQGKSVDQFLKSLSHDEVMKYIKNHISDYLAKNSGGKINE